jgi:hypothetical protein
LGAVPLANNKGQSVEDLAESLDLRRKSPETIPIGLDLVAMDQAIHHREVYARKPAAQPEFLEHN